MFSSFTNNSVRKKFKLSLSIALVFTLILCGVGLFSSINSTSKSTPTISVQDPIVKPEDKVEEETPNDEFESGNNTDVVVAEEKLVLPFSVDATVVKNGKAKKVIVFKYKPKKGSKTKQGHRQPYTKVKIEKINA